MTTPVETQPISRVQLRKTAAATVVGNFIEFYDFTVYGTLTALVFGRLFFATEDTTVATFLTLATFGVGFLSRPLGGIVFGHFGDKLGRKPVLVMSLLTMGGATALMGLLPTYHAAGWIGPVLLVCLRFVQGLGIGGEWGGAITLMLENAPEKKRGFFGALVQTGSGLGIILATGMVTVLATALTPEQLDAWGWRIPLLFSLLLVVVGLIIRARIEESPEFHRMQRKSDVSRAPIWETLRRHWAIVLLAIGMYIGIAAFGFTQGVYYVSYLSTTVQVSEAVATTANLVAAAFYVLAIVLGGYLSDKLGRVRTYILGGILLIPAPFIMFAGGATGNTMSIYITMAIVGVMTGVGYGSQAALFFELFPTRVRYTGISLGFQIAAVLGGGITPLLAAVLTESTGSTLGISFYLAGLAVLLILCTLFAPRIVRKEAGR
ncbi:MFS transporter [Brevibacterium linens]|uniref:MFS transporter n=1 Tax=Brevibacterium linens TaxID=1703 RepID=UPI003BF4AA0C